MSIENYTGKIMGIEESQEQDNARYLESDEGLNEIREHVKKRWISQKRWIDVKFRANGINISLVKSISNKKTSYVHAVHRRIEIGAWIAVAIWIHNHPEYCE